MSITSPSWWGTFEFVQGEARRWSIGPLRMTLQRCTNEWRVCHERVGRSDHAFEVGASAPAVGSGENVARFLTRELANTVRVLPALADRAVIVRPDTALYILPRQELTLYLASPLWLCLELGVPASTVWDHPIELPSEIWFGRATREGELGYASRSHASAALHDVVPLPHRATTPVLLRNRSSALLTIDRINLPVAVLSLYAAPGGQLWTQGVTMELQEDQRTVALHLDRHAPASVPGLEWLRGPRAGAESNLLVRAWDALISTVRSEVI